MGYTYSVIIPHYNIPDLLIRCLDSIPVRDDIQVIAVDDFSPGGEDYLDRYPQLSRPHLTYIRAPRNGGCGWARNLALPHAEGTWLVFADADDCFSEGAFDIMNRYADSDADIIYFRMEERTEGDWQPGVHFGWIYAAFKRAEETGNDKCVCAAHIPPWGKMVRRSFVENLGVLFDETRHSEDVLFSLRTAAAAKKVIIAQELVYYVYLRQGSQTNSGILPLHKQIERTKVAILANGIYRSSFHSTYDYVYETLSELCFTDFWAFCRLLPLAFRNKVSLRRILRGIYLRFTS